MSKASLTAFTDTNAGSFEMKNSLLSRVHIRGVVAGDGGEGLIVAVARISGTVFDNAMV